MNKTGMDSIRSEDKTLIKCILKGMSLEETAKLMSCSKSCVSYKTLKLLKLFDVKTKFDFTIKIFSDILNKNKKEIKQKNVEINTLKQELAKIKRLIKEIISTFSNKNEILNIMKKFNLEK